jgi:hypothetical protein
MTPASLVRTTPERGAEHDGQGGQRRDGGDAGEQSGQAVDNARTDLVLGESVGPAVALGAVQATASPYARREK